jgi:hypothetical protein
VLEPPLLFLQLNVELTLIVVTVLDLRVVRVVIAGLKLGHCPFHPGDTFERKTLND